MGLEHQEEEKERRNSCNAERREEAALRKTHSHVMGVYFVQGLPQVLLLITFIYLFNINNKFLITRTTKYLILLIH